MSAASGACALHIPHSCRDLEEVHVTRLRSNEEKAKSMSKGSPTWLSCGCASTRGSSEVMGTCIWAACGGSWSAASSPANRMGMKAEWWVRRCSNVPAMDSTPRFEVLSAHGQIGHVSDTESVGCQPSKRWLGHIAAMARETRLPCCVLLHVSV